MARRIASTPRKSNANNKWENKENRCKWLSMSHNINLCSARKTILPKMSLAVWEMFWSEVCRFYTWRFCWTLWTLSNSLCLISTAAMALTVVVLHNFSKSSLWRLWWPLKLDQLHSYITACWRNFFYFFRSSLITFETKIIIVFANMQSTYCITATDGQITSATSHDEIMF